MWRGFSAGIRLIRPLPTMRLNSVANVKCFVRVREELCYKRLLLKRVTLGQCKKPLAFYTKGLIKNIWFHHKSEWWWWRDICQCCNVFLASMCISLMLIICIYYLVYLRVGKATTMTMNSYTSIPFCKIIVGANFSIFLFHKI